MTDIVIPLGSGSIWGDEEELKHALRSVEKHLNNVGKVIIIGKKPPKWITNITFLYKEDEVGIAWKDRNIYSKILTACEASEVSENFLFMNDDHFLTMDFDLPYYPYYFRENDMISTIVANHKNIAWMTAIENTRKFLLSNGYDAKMYDTHTPIMYNKQAFVNSVSQADWNVPFGYGIKSLYGNMNDVGGLMMPDAKLFSSETNHDYMMKKISNKPCFSTSPYIPAQQKELIEKFFPNKSKWEF